MKVTIKEYRNTGTGGRWLLNTATNRVYGFAKDVDDAYIKWVAKKIASGGRGFSSHDFEATEDRLERTLKEYYFEAAPNKAVKVWECKIIIAGDADLPNGFDSPPRQAAIEAVESAGFKVLGCFSGWGGELTKGEAEIVRSAVEDTYIIRMSSDDLDIGAH